MPKKTAAGIIYMCYDLLIGKTNQGGDTMSCYKHSMLDSFMNNIGGRKSCRMSWTKLAATGALIYLGTKMLRGMMDGND
jgi:hypothetical protein